MKEWEGERDGWLVVEEDLYMYICDNTCKKKKREWKYGRGLDVWWVLTGLVKEECL